MNAKETLAKLRAADSAYFNTGDTIMSDREYNVLRDKLADVKVPDSKLSKEIALYLSGTGVAPDGSGKDVRLPIFMPSLDKIKNDELKELDKFIARVCKLSGSFDHEFVCSPKLDGSSLQLRYSVKTLQFVSAATRGNGTVGRDVTAHAKVLIRAGKIPAKLKDDQNVAKWRKLGVKELYVRCELMIAKGLFKKKWEGKEVNGKKLVEARNAVNGWITAKSINTEFVKDLTVFALQISSKELPNGVLHKFKQLQFLADSKFFTYRQLPGYSRFPRDEIGNAGLNTKLKEAVAGPFECDGIVVEVNDYVTRHKLDKGNKRPVYAFAYKVSHNATEGQDVKRTTVLRIDWNPSKDGRAAPLVHYKPVMFGNTKNTKATGVNAKHIKKMKLGKGAVIEVVRAGGVIPRIVRTITPAPGKILPQRLPDGTELVYLTPHLYIKDVRKSEVVKFKQLEASLKYLEVDGLAGTRIQQVYDAGYTTLAKLTKASVADLAALDRWGSKLATSVYKGLRTKLKDANLYELMVVSNLFMVPGFSLASSRLEVIEDALGSKMIRTEVNMKKVRTKLDGVKGLGAAAIDCFIANLPAYQKFHATLAKTKTI